MRVRRRLLALFLLLLTACSAPRDRVVLLDAPGALRVATPRATTTLETPYATAAVHADGRVQPGTTTPAQVQQRYGAVLATLPEAGRVWVLYFATGGTQLTPQSQAEVPGLLAEVARRGVCEVEITGHTDTVGDALQNDALSVARAAAVQSLLVDAGLQATFVRVVGRGERAPIVETADEVDEPRNRRVDVRVR